MAEEFLRIEKLVRAFGANQVVKGVDLAFNRGEFISLLGPSGCGKTTILRMIAGFERPTSGAIFVEGRDITALAPNRRNVGMVFQAYALFPNMNVFDNVAFGLKVAGTPKAESAARVDEMLKLVGLSGLEKRFPFEMSGGQQQRVALARALAPSPRMLLLDEPLSALDAKIRVSLREQIREIQRNLGITTIFVTHDQEEAPSISDRIVVMNAGRTDQVGTPAEIYNRPATRFVASFVGTLNMIDAVVADPAANTVRVGDQVIVLREAIAGRRGGEKISLALRPEAGSLDGAGDTALRGEVISSSFLGSVVRTKLAIGENAVSFDTFNAPDLRLPAPGEIIDLHFSAGDLLLVQD